MKTLTAPRPAATEFECQVRTAGAAKLIEEFRVVGVVEQAEQIAAEAAKAYYAQTGRLVYGIARCI